MGRLQKYPKIHVSTGEESSGSGPDSTQGLRPRHRRESNPERPPRNSPGDWPFLRPAERLPEVPVPRIDSHQVCTWDSPVRKPHGKASWPRIDSHQVCTWDSPVRKPHGKASWPRIDSHQVCTWDSPVRKPHGKASWPRIDSHQVCTWDSPVRKPHGKASWPRIDSHQVCTWDSPVRKPHGKASWPRIDSHQVCTWDSPVRKPHGKASWPRIDSHQVCTWDSPVRKPHGKASWPRIDSHQVCTWDSPVRKPHGKASWAKNSRRSRRISRGGALHRKGERNSRVVPPFQESRRCFSPFQRNLFSLHCLDVQAEDRLPPGVHVGQPCAKASWESLMGKTRGKTIDPLLHAADCVTRLLPLWRKAQVYARIRDED
ncbi:hypothetical protein MJG53_000123 [Ovis ammon polii x Ovis aries]|nr:hypothetical protein MJG53_000123 [Ovis ammon polii x Ovis aries]